VLAALLLIVAIAAGLTIHLARSGALTILGITNGDTESSLNWSGYVVSHARFTSVTATWTVPAVRSISDPGATASFWVGLDGRDGRSLQQIGTTSGVTGATRHYGAWWEMLPGPAVDVPVAVAPGDSITASVVADGQGSFLLSLSDNTNGQRFTTRQVDAAAPLSSAEVVAEAPSSRDGLLPLADFGAVHFAGARANGRPLGDFESSRVIMTSGSRTLASASALSPRGTAFTVFWTRP
jgi:Peptidase A4 family